MGDAENTIPPSKKRAAGRELSRDNPGLDDEEEVPGQETGTFKRASEEVLANRRIVKVRRNQTSSAPSAPSTNPFSAICLVPSPDSAAAAAAPAPVNNLQEISKTAPQEVESQHSGNEKTEKGDDVDGKQPEIKVDQVEAVPGADEEKEGASEVRKPESSDAEAAAKGQDSEAKEETGNEAKKETESKGVENAENKDSTEGNEAKKETESKGVENAENKHSSEGNVEKNTGAASVSSFQQLSSSQNAFTGLVGTGFSNSTFSFGSIPKSDQPTFPSFSFGTNGNTSLFDNPPGASVGVKTEGSKIPSMQEVLVETGEENEKAVFTADSVLFEFLDGGWKERGKGELKVNVVTSGTKKARLVMRARGNYRLILNASIFPDMKLTNMEKKGITFACLNSTGEGKDGLSTFALKFKDASIVEEFRSVVMEHRGNTAAPTLNTPENSPKASEE